MKRIKTIQTRDLAKSAKCGGCGECQTSCQSACKTSCGVANQKCENKNKYSFQRKVPPEKAALFHAGETLKWCINTN
jgi:predicted ribosomally synthesized six-cysteine peptide SCIFF